MVACAAVSVQLSCPDWMQPQSAGCSAVDQLKQQLLLAVENENVDEANDVLAKLEKSGMTKEILEVRVCAAHTAHHSEWRCVPRAPHTKAPTPHRPTRFH
uniref:TFIIS N-terminal domain-containing protein n=1 Tax=Parascaris univalens TaxID=6257 RepID=A0A914ZU51_PARUN